MRILQLTFHDKELDWKLEKTSFSNLTLLVGISGVGKTQILDSIWTLKRIADGSSASGVKWEVLFSTINNDEYCWRGEYEIRSTPDDDPFLLHMTQDPQIKPKIITEELTKNGEILVERRDSDIYLRGDKTPKLSPYESALSILNQEEDIAPAYESFSRIIRSDYTDYRGSMVHPEISEYNRLRKKGVSLEEIQESNLASRLKVALVFHCSPEIFNKIKERFIEVFPQVEDVRFVSPKKSGVFFFEEFPLLEIKEVSVKNWVSQRKISSGMYKTFMHLSEMYLWKEGTVILIDEFENSLGINCIDVLTEDLLQENRRLQFIVTSHHPYIINNISPKYWKVVTRNGSVVSTQDASSLRLESSSHQAFIQLINREEFKEGITAS